MTNDAFSNDNRPTTHLASAWRTLCGLSAPHPWFWLARSASTETLPLLALVLFDGLSGFLGGAGTGVCGHG
jgi:hypothetical protein